MKKLFYKTLIVFVLVALVIPFVLQDRFGRQMMSLSDLRMPDISIPEFVGLKKLVDTVGRVFSHDAGDNDDVINVYKWQDKEGVWHYSEVDNSYGDGEHLKLKRSAALVGDPNSVSDTVSKKVSDQQKNDDQKAALQLPDILDIPILNASETIEKAKQVEQMLQARFQRQEKMLD